MYQIKNFYGNNKKFIEDNAFVIIGSLVSGLGSYLFHFYSGRSLGPIEYGKLGVIISISYIISIFVYVIQLSITRFVSELKSENKYFEIKYLIKDSLKKFIITGLVLTVLFLFFSTKINLLLGMPVSSLILISPFILFAFVLPVGRGVLQGFQKFKHYSINLISEGITKIVLALILISIGLGLSGATIAITFSYIMPFIITIPLLRKIMRSKEEKLHMKPFYLYNIPTLIVISSLTLFYSLDIILVKYFLTSTEAGYYTAASVLGKIIFFTISPISLVMFPRISKDKFENKKILYKSLTLLLGIGSLITLCYYIAPGFIISTLFGYKYLAIKNVLGAYGVLTVFFCLAYILSFYNLAQKKNNIIPALILFNILQILLITYFHQSINQIVTVLTLLFISLSGLLAIITCINQKANC